MKIRNTGSKSSTTSNMTRVSVKLRRISVVQSLQSIELDGRLSESFSVENVTKWYEEIYNHLNKTNHLDVLQESDRLFNMKEVQFPLLPMDPVNQISFCLSNKVYLSFYLKASSSVTVFVMISASGQMASPTVFYPCNELPPKNIFDSETNSCGVSGSPKNLIANDNTLSYMQDIFHPWLISKKIKFPVIAFFDSDPVYLSWAVLSFCKTNEIILLSTTSAHSLHPINSFVVPHLKNAWISELREWNNKNENRPLLANDSVTPILKRVFETVTVDLLKTAFRKCGMFPFNPLAAYNKGLTNSTSESTSQLSPQPLHQPTPQPSLQEINLVADEEMTNTTTQSTSQLASQHLSQPIQSASNHTLQKITSVAASNGGAAISAFQHTFNVVSEDTNQPTSSLSPHHLIRAHSTPQPTDVLQKIEFFCTQFEELLGALLHEFKNSENFWKGAIENLALYEIWKRLLNTSRHVFLPTFQSTEQPTLQLIESKQLFRMQFEEVIGPLLFEFKNSENVWKGAIENTSLFEVWQSLVKSPQSEQLSELQVNDSKPLFQMQFEEFIGPFLYELKNSGNVWKGSIKNTALFEVWKRLLIDINGSVTILNDSER